MRRGQMGPSRCPRQVREGLEAFARCSPTSLRLEDADWLARLSGSLAAAVLLAGPVPLTARVARGERIKAAGGEVAIVLRGESAVWDGLVCHAAGLALAWEADPRLGPEGTTAASLLDRVGGALGRIRLIGGGPEAARQGGADIGDLMSQLALHAYAGTLVLAPSTPRFGVAWQHWLGRRGSRGCGGSDTASSFVPIEGRPVTGGQE